MSDERQPFTGPDSDVETQLADLAWVAQNRTRFFSELMQGLLDNLLPCGHFRAEECHCEDRSSSGES